MREMYAFWKYDLCPYVSCGRITKFLDNGRVRVKGLGTNSFLPVVVLDEEEGRAAHERVRALQSEYREAELRLKEEYELATLKVIGLTTTRTRLQ